MSNKEILNFYDLSYGELISFFNEKGFENYRIKQVLNWVYGKDVINAEKMKNLPSQLKEELLKSFSFELTCCSQVLKSEDGSSKYIFRALDGIEFESVLIPEKDKLTLCISTQAGCKMKCAFCFTGKQGLKRNLLVHEIISQYIYVRRKCGEGITNIVFMGMGEPLDNYDNLKKSVENLISEQMLSFSARRITVSTSGILDKIRSFIEWNGRINLAISLNSADSPTRSKLMPVNRKYPLEKLLAFCREIKLPNRRRITFEYIMLGGINDREEDIKLLKKKLRGIRCKINLIMFNPFPDCEYESCPAERVKEFADKLRMPGLSVMIRKSRGKDIMAACGQLGKKSLR